METTGHVSANLSVCAGTGMCEQVAENLFRLGADHKVSVLTDRLEAESDVEAALDAMNSYPTAAISVRLGS